MGNRLARETSPYLRQHAANPVDWYPWGGDAFAEARRSARPVMLSVGYSACHWCHVMAHESFEDPAIAAVMNELFVNIKVDREERPDVDGLYMQAVQAMTGSGGWPMTVFCTPEGVPFYGGTYFPPHRMRGMPAFPEVLRAVSEAYHANPDAVAKTGAQLRDLMRVTPLPSGSGEPGVEQLDRAAEVLVDQTDFEDGGFGGAPKFPHPAALDLLLRRQAATRPRCWDAAEVSLDLMSRGGICDQVGGGFHRYSVDARWAVPHFEKMLYDNAQLIPVYLHAYQLSGRARFLRVVTETCDYVLREMALPAGGFASSQDADSEGEEGRFFVWTGAQLVDVLGADDGVFAARLFGVGDAGNFEHGTTVLSLPAPLEDVATEAGVSLEELERRRASVRARLYEARARRIAPARDDKVLTSWNALMLRALAESGAVLENRRYLDAARRCADFLLAEVCRDGRVLRTWKDGEAKITGFLEDVAFLCDALLTLYEATGERRWFAAAEGLAGDMVDRYWDPQDGFFDTAADAEPLLVRPRTVDDNPLPAGQSVAAIALLRLHALTAEPRWRTVAMSVVAPLAAGVARAPLALASLAQALDLAVSPPREIAIAGSAGDPATRALVREVHARFDRSAVLAWGDPVAVPLLEGRTTVDGRPAAYVCRNFACERPVTDPAELRALLAE